MAKSLWDRLLPAVEAVMQANRRAGIESRLPLKHGLAEQKPEIGHLIIQLTGSVAEQGTKPLPLEGRYWDTDGHAVFLIAFRRPDGEIAEVELYRLDQQPIDKIPAVADLEISETKPGYYDTTRPQAH